MIDRYKALEKKYGSIHNHLRLVAIENLAIPVTKIEIEVLGQQIDDILPTTEFILRFIDIGINTIDLLSEALGFQKLLIENLVTLEESSGNVTYSLPNEQIELTKQGRNTLITKLASSPKTTVKELLFDNCLWDLAHWRLGEFESKVTLNKAKVEYNAVQKKSKNRVTQADFDVTKINRELARQSKKVRFEVHQLHRVISRRNGFKIARIMVFYSDSKECDFIVVINDERSIEHEKYIKSVGGLGTLGIEFEPVSSDETKLVIEARSEEQPEVPIAEDGRAVEPYEHAEWLDLALENSSRRLFVMSPWVHERVVSRIFIERIERLLKKNVQVVIAWGFGTDRDSEANKSSKWPLGQLLKLSEKYPNNFKFIKMNESHAKVLISDDFYIATSFNWLSYRGDKRMKYRTEFGEMRTAPEIVENRFALMMSECSKHGQPMSEKLIPN